MGQDASHKDIRKGGFFLVLFFYYPSDEYISYLMTLDEIMFLDEIECRDLFFGNNKREKIIIFQLV